MNRPVRGKKRRRTFCWDREVLLSFLWLLRCRERVGIGIRIAPCDGEGAEAGVVHGAVRVELQIHPRLRARLRGKDNDRLERDRRRRLHAPRMSARPCRLTSR